MLSRIRAKLTRLARLPRRRRVLVLLVVLALVALVVWLWRRTSRRARVSYESVAECKKETSGGKPKVYFPIQDKCISEKQCKAMKEDDCRIFNGLCDCGDAGALFDVMKNENAETCKAKKPEKWYDPSNPGKCYSKSFCEKKGGTMKNGSCEGLPSKGTGPGLGILPNGGKLPDDLTNKYVYITAAAARPGLKCMTRTHLHTTDQCNYNKVIMAQPQGRGSSVAKYQMFAIIPVAGEKNTYYIYSAAKHETGKCNKYLSVEECGKSNNVDFWGQAGVNQKWIIAAATGGGYFIRSAARTGCRGYLSFKSCTDGDASEVDMWDKPGDNQRFNITKVY